VTTRPCLRQSAEVAAYLEFNRRRAELDVVAMEAMRGLVQFWTELLAPSPSIDTLSVVGERARASLTATVAHLDRLLVLNPASVPTLRLAAVIHMEVLGDLARAAELFDEADHVEACRCDATLSCDYGSFLREVDVALDIFDPQNGIINVSMGEDAFALVEHANAAALAMFGHVASAVIGQNVSKLIAEPIASHHDAYIRNYLGQKQGSMVVGKTRMVLGRHAEGHLLPLALHVRWSDEALGKMIAVVRPLSSPQELCCIVESDTRRITAATSNLPSLCGFSRRDLLAQRLTLADLLPPLRDDDHDVVEAALQAAQGSRGLHCDGEHAVTRQRCHLHAFLSVVPVIATSFIFLRLAVSRAAGDGDASAASDCEDEGPVVGEPRGSLLGVASQPAIADVLHIGIDDDQDEPALAPRSPAHSLHGLPPPSPSSASNETRPMLRADAESPRSSASSFLAVPGPSTPSAPAGPAGRSSASSATLLLRSHSPVLDHNTETDVESPPPSPQRSSRALLTLPSSSSAATEADASAATLPSTPSTALADSMGSAPAKRIHTRTRRVKHVQSRLRRAIAQDERSTARQLRWMDLSSAAMIVLVLVLNILLFALSSQYIEESRQISHNIHLSSTREALLIDALISLRVLYSAKDATIPRLLELFYSPGAHASNSREDIFNGIRDRLLFSIELYTEISRAVDSIPTSNAALLRIREQDVVPISLIDHQGTPTLQQYPLRYASVTFSALAHLSVNLPTADPLDPGFYFCLYNGLGAMRVALENSTNMLLTDLETVHSKVLLVMLVILGSSLAGVIAVALLFARPLIVRVETAKTRVLDILRQVPHAFRRRLRRKALSVFRLVQREAARDEDRGVSERQRGIVLDADMMDDPEEDQAATDAATSEADGGASVAAGESAYSRDYRLRGLGAGMGLRTSVATQATELTAMDDAHADADHESFAPTGSPTSAPAVATGSMLSRSSIRGVVAKYAVFVVTIAVFFGLCYWQTFMRFLDVEQAAVVMVVGNYRLPYLQLAYFEARQFTFFNYTATSPYDPTRVLGPFDDAARQMLGAAQQVSHVSTL
jgi:PAS domain S-box-containing protein